MSSRNARTAQQSIADAEPTPRRVWVASVRLDPGRTVAE